MRIVHLDQMFHPEFGDQINVLPKYQVMQGHEVYVVTGESNVPHPRFKYFADNTNMQEKDNMFEKNTGVKIIRVGVRGFFSGRAIFKPNLKQTIDDLKPDILFCHFNDTVYGIYYTWIASKLNYPVIFDSHMLAMASKNQFRRVFRKFYRLFVTPIIIKNNLKVIKTQPDDYVNNYLGIPESLTPLISFGSDMALFHPDFRVKQKLREEFNISDEDFVVLYTGKLTESKGGKLLGQAFKDRFETSKDVILVVVGNITGSQYEKEAKQLFEQSENRIIQFPTQKYEALPKFYQMADVSVFPRQSSLSFYDAQACGLPVIAESNNVNLERLSHNNGFTFKADCWNDFRRKILDCVQLSDKEYQVMAHNAYQYVKENYDYQNISRQYTNVLTKEYEQFMGGECCD